jgi:prepilin-type N-terminal cleavage/methylation domain-containing protein
MHAHIPSPDRRDEGFTLVELLIVIVILGVLSTVTVFAVNGIASRGETASTSADEQTVVRAQEAYFALYSSYGTEAELLAEGLLNRESTTHDISLVNDGEDYTLVAQGAGGAVTTVPAPTWPQGQVDTVVFQGMNAEQYGSGPQVAVLINSTFGNVDMDWSDFTNNEPAIPGMTMYYIDDPALDSLAEIDALIDNSDFQFMPPNTQIEGEYLLQYALARTNDGYPAPGYDMSSVWLWRYAPGATITDFVDFLANDFEDGAPVGDQTTYAGFDAWIPGDFDINDLQMVVVASPSSRAVYNEWLFETVANARLTSDRVPLYIEVDDATTAETLHSIVIASPVPVLLAPDFYNRYIEGHGEFSMEAFPLGQSNLDHFYVL